jgi:mxaJ protein
LNGRTITANPASGPLRLLVAIGACLGLAAVLCALGVDGAKSAGSHSLRVCADPDNMPFSDEKGEGFENKLAELIAQKLDAQLEYTWFAEASGYVPNTVGSNACDLVMGYAQGTGLIEDTNPYYYTSYLLIYRQGDPNLEGVDRLSDPRLKNKRIGLFARTPPASILAMHGLVANAKPFETHAGESASKTAMAMIAEIASGELDAGLLWGPVGGYYAQRSSVPLKLVPLVKENAGPSTIYGITMGVRPNEPQWKHKINKVLAENQGDINVILQGYNVPVLDEKGNLITAAAAER